MSRFIEILDDQSVGLEKRLFEVFTMYNRLDTYAVGTWCDLFKTAHNKRIKETKERLYEHIKFLIRRTYPAATRFEYKLIGSRGRVDVQLRRRQRILLCIYKGSSCN